MDVNGKGFVDVPDGMVTRKMLAGYLQVSRSRLTEIIGYEGFPKPISTFNRNHVYDLGQVNEFVGKIELKRYNKDDPYYDPAHGDTINNRALVMAKHFYGCLNWANRKKYYTKHKKCGI